MPPTRQVIALLVALALIAGACRSEATIGQVGAQPPDQTATDQAAPQEAAPQQSAPPPPTEAAGPAAPAEPSPTPAPSRADYEGTRPAAFEAPASWAEPLPLDPQVTQGVLANGLTYLVKRNGRPGSQAQLRLIVHAGSLNEEPGTEGVAHFLEHMMFNGTERFPDNEIVKVLESFGSGFGPDVNAYTSYHETVYELQVPARSSETLQLGLDVLHQWATAATIEPDAVVSERGVVREEYRRSVEQLSGRLGAQVREVLFDGTDYLGSDPIGSVEVIQSMTETELRAFYERWYRPELMTIIVVGDVDVADIERRIGATFVQPATDPPTKMLEIVDAQGSLPEPVFDVLTDAEIQRAEVEVLWRLADEPATTMSALRADIAGFSSACKAPRLSLSAPAPR